MDIHSDTAAPCRGNLNYWFGCWPWHKELGASENYSVSPSFFSYVMWELGYWVYIWCIFLFSHSTKHLLPPVWQQELSGKLLKTHPYFAITFSLSYSCYLSSIISVCLTHNTRKWCVPFIADIFLHSSSILNQLFIFHTSRSFTFSPSLISPGLGGHK